MGRKALGLVKFALAFSAIAWPARAKDDRVWILSGLEAKSPSEIYLTYAVPETDDMFGAFSCKPGSGAVVFSLYATSAKLKAGKDAVASLSVGGVRAKVRGRLTANEEAGVPGFEGRLPDGAGILRAMAEGGMLAATVGPSRQTASLTGAAEKVRKFAAACDRP